MLNKNTILLIPVFSLLLLSCGKDKNKAVSAGPVATNVEAVEITPSDFERYLETIGIILARTDVSVIAEEGGTLVKIYVDKGTRVKKGTPLAELKNSVLMAQLEQAKARYSSDSLTYKHQSSLVSVNGIADVTLKQAKYRMELSFANLKLMRARAAKLLLKAPITGLLDQRYFDLGGYVPPMSKYGHMVNLDKVKIKIDIAERYSGNIDPDSEVRVTFDALPELEFKGKIGFIGSVVDPKSRTFPLEVVLDNRRRLLKPNMLANVKVLLFHKTNQLVVPRDAILDEGKKQFVFIKKGPLALRKYVSIKDVYLDKAWLSGGLNFGDSLIVSGQRDLVDSSYVKLIEAEK